MEETKPLTKKEKKLLKRQQKEKERTRHSRRQQLKRAIFWLGIPILVIGAIFLAKPLFSNPKNNIDSSQKISFDRAVEKSAPDFSLKDTEGNEIKLSNFLGKNVVLFFNEGLMCYPACLDQVVALNKDGRLNNSETVSFSIVVDSPQDWQKAYKNLPYLEGAKVLFDSGAKVSRDYNVLFLNSSMHRGQMPGHTYFLIDKTGIIRFAFDDPKMGIRNDELYSELQKLK